MSLTTNRPQMLHTEQIGSAFYGRSSDCIWYLTAIDDDFITITFRLVHIEYDKDFLRIGYGRNATLATEVMRLTGFQAPSHITFNSSSLWIRFTSDWHTQWLGFYIAIQSSPIFGSYTFRYLWCVNL